MEKPQPFTERPKPIETIDHHSPLAYEMELDAERHIVFFNAAMNEDIERLVNLSDVPFYFNLDECFISKEGTRKLIEILFQLGSLGIKCDEEGRITAVDKKAEIGDEVRVGK